MKLLTLYIPFFMSLISVQVYSQDTLKKMNSKSSEVVPANNSYRSSDRNVSNLKNVEDAISENNNEKKYQEYIKIADNLSQEKKYQESNIYLNKALEFYSKTKNKKKQSQIHRKIAQNDEKLKNAHSALDQYKKAQDLAEDKTSNSILSNDIERVQNVQSPRIKEETLEKNIRTYQSENNREDLSHTYQQLADAALENQDTQKAIDALIQTQKTSVEKEDKIKAKEQLADIYASQDSISAAITLVKDARKLSIESYDWPNYYNQTIKLSQFYMQSGYPDSAAMVLKESLDIAYRNNNTQAVLILTKELKDFYSLSGNSISANQYIDSLLLKLWDIAIVDTNIYQDAIFNEVQERISLLEKDKETQSLLFQKTKKYNSVLTVILACLIIAIASIIISLYKLRKKNFLILLQSLRREMNPHFIFNALNSVNLFIANNDELSANKYLTRYSSLMRNMMNASNKNFIQLEEDLVTLRDYVMLEHMRFEDKFEFEIIVDETLKEERYLIPNMIIQPFVENAIWHGLRYKEDKGLLKIQFSNVGAAIQVTISDDGIGVAKSQEIKSKNQKTHKSIGISNTMERIEMLNKLFKSNIKYQADYLDKNNKTGHQVTITWNKKISTHETD